MWGILIVSRQLKIVTWNCGGAFRKKCEVVENAYQPDVLIVQECEDPAQSTRSYREWSGHYLWLGDNKNKGIGIFDRSGIGIEQLDWPSENFESFLPCRLGNGLTLLAVWTKYANSPNFRYIGQLWKYLQLNHERLAEAKSALVVGDLNSNTCWDEWDRWWNHSDVVRELAELGIESFYHRHFEEQQGQESRPTLYHRRKRDKPYHVDYIFGARGLLKQGEAALSVGGPDEWLDHSDHMPLAVQVAC